MKVMAASHQAEIEMTSIQEVIATVRRWRAESFNVGTTNNGFAGHETVTFTAWNTKRNFTALLTREEWREVYEGVYGA